MKLEIYKNRLKFNINQISVKYYYSTQQVQDFFYLAQGGISANGDQVIIVSPLA